MVITIRTRNFMAYKGEGEKGREVEEAEITNDLNKFAIKK